jgi:hypothetical protein
VVVPLQTAAARSLVEIWRHGAAGSRRLAAHRQRGWGLGLRTVVVPQALWTASLGALLGSRAPAGRQGCVHGGGVWPRLAAEPGTVVVPVSG